MSVRLIVLVVFDFLGHQLHKFIMLTTHTRPSGKSYLRKCLLSILAAFKLVAVVILADSAAAMLLLLLLIVTTAHLITVRVARITERSMSASEYSLFLLLLST